MNIKQFPCAYQTLQMAEIGHVQPRMGTLRHAADDWTIPSATTYEYYPSTCLALPIARPYQLDLFTHMLPRLAANGQPSTSQSPPHRQTELIALHLLHITSLPRASPLCVSPCSRPCTASPADNRPAINRPAIMSLKFSSRHASHTYCPRLFTRIKADPRRWGWSARKT
jgi:hypothetical protein